MESPFLTQYLSNLAFYDFYNYLNHVKGLYSYICDFGTCKKGPSTDPQVKFIMDSPFIIENLKIAVLLQ